MRPATHIMTWIAAVALGGIAGCAPAIGDSCGASFDCSVNGDRVCDVARPGGACTVYACEADNCPDEAVCVRWRPDPTRLSFTACMQRCEVDENCRMDEGYRCKSVAEITTTPEGGEPIAELVDEMRDDEGRFCVVDPDFVVDEE